MALRTASTVLSMALALGACSTKSGDKEQAKGPAKSGPVVARVGADVITADEVKARLAEQSPFLQARYKDLVHRREFVQNLVRSEILSQEAHRRGLDVLPEVQNTIKKILVQELIRREFDEKQASYPESELKAYYDKRIDEFVKPERVRAQHIFLAAPAGKKAERAKAKAKAQELLGKIKANDALAPAAHPKHAQYSATLFSDLAREFTNDEGTKVIGGDLRYLSLDDISKQYTPEFAKAVFALANPNDLSGVIETSTGFHVAKMTARQAALNRQFEDQQVKDTIKGRMFRETKTRSFDEYVEKLKKEANVTIDDAVLGAIEVPGQAPAAPAVAPPAPAPVKPAAAPGK